MYTENRKQSEYSAKKRTFFFHHHTISVLKCKGGLSKKRRKKNDVGREEEAGWDPENQIKKVKLNKERKNCRKIEDLHKKVLYKKILCVMIKDRVVVRNQTGDVNG